MIVGKSTNKMLSTETLKYSARAGVQVPTHFEHAAHDVLEVALNTGPYELAGLTLTTIQTNAEKVEVNSVT